VTGEEFKIYCSGVLDGSVLFSASGLELSRVDRRTRAQLKREPFAKESRVSLIDYHFLYEHRQEYEDAVWEGDTVELPCARKYSRYEQISDTDGRTAQIWAQRNSLGVTDVITLEGRIIAFFNPGRVISELAVLPGHEPLTPLTQYGDPLLSKADCGVIPTGTVFVPMRDGVGLATEVFLPAGADTGKKVPAIVVRTCYGRQRDIDRCWHWTARGYALVVQDVRGRSDSDGILEPFQNEREDASDLFDWIAAQDWSDGNIGMWGASYLGYTTTAAATSGNVHLKTAVSEVNVGSPFYDTARRGGTICSWPLLCWTLGQSVSNRTDFRVFAGESVDVVEAVTHRPITGIPQKILGKASGPWDLWAKHYHYDDFWRHSDNTVHSRSIRIPMLIMSGWYDGDALGVQETWRFLSANDTPGRRIVLGPWPHALNAFRDCLDLAFGNNAVDYGFDLRIIRWFDRYLKGIENGEDRQPRCRYYLVGENRWIETSDWDPPEAKPVRLYLAGGGRANSLFGDGRITLSPQEETGWDEYVYDPTQPIRGVDDHVTPYVCNFIQQRADCLCYDTEPLTGDAAMAGCVNARFYASSSAPDTDFIVRVSDVDEKGVARKVSDNVIRAEFRNGWDNPSLLTPGEVQQYSLHMYFNACVFRAGHKIRIDITSSDEMQFFPNTNTGINPYDDPEPQVCRNRIWYGGATPSYVEIPFLYGLENPQG